jgi:hypothetical protein
MSMRFARVSPALALTVGALALAGCGGGSSGGGGGTGTTGTTGGGTASGATLTPAQWKTQVESISTQLKAAFAPLQTNGKDPDTWFTLATNLKKINAKVAAIKAPPVAAPLTAAIASGIAPLSGEATTIGNDLKSGDQTQAKQDAGTLEKSLIGLLSKISNALLKLKPGTTT